MANVDQVRVAAAALLLVGCATTTEIATPTTGSWLDNEGHPINEEQIRDRIGKARFVLVGEAHDNKCDHEHEWAVGDLMSAGGPWALGMEMVATDLQPVLDHFSDGSMSLSDLPGALQWTITWGYAFDWYAPSLVKAAAGHVPIIGLNAPAPVTRVVRDAGLNALPMTDRLTVTPTIIAPTAEQETTLREAFAEHQKLKKESVDDKAAWESFSRVEAFWDTQMAWRAHQVVRATKRRVLILAGMGHVEHGWGIASRLKLLLPDAGILTIMPFRGGKLDSTEGDLFFYCPEQKATPPT